MKRAWILASAFLVAACSTGQPEKLQPATQPVTLEFFTVKEETRPIFNHLIEEFEAEHPHIHIEQVIVPNGMSVLKTRIARGDVPDLFITYPLEQDYIIRAQKGYMLNLTNEMFLDRIQPTIQERYSVNGQMYGAAFTQNAVGVLYNKKVFEELNLSVPTTWSEWIAVMEKLKQAGKQPLVMANKEANQTSILTLNFVANAFPPSYWKNPDQLETDAAWKNLTQKLKTILSYTDQKTFNMGYAEANEAFAFEEGTMYVMGTWALPKIEKLNPALDYGIFPVPVSNNPEENRVLGGVDIGIGISSETNYPEAAKMFLAFLTEEPNAQGLSLYEGSVSTVMGVQKTKEQLAPLEEKVQSGETVNWPNHYWAGGTAAESEYRQYTLQFFYDQDEQVYLRNLERMFNKYRDISRSKQVNE